MNHKEFTESVLRTARTDLPKDKQLHNILLGIAGESGEILDCFKKQLFQDHPQDSKKIMNEVGDVLFYLYWLAEVEGFTIAECMDLNKEKLQKRYPLAFSSDLSLNRVEE
jgi:NTP pyrophosphatase (non-canonical NTP hydrolase)